MTKLRLRGIGPWLVAEYLKDLGGQEAEPGHIAGPDWEARITAGDPIHIGAIRLGVTEITFTGEPQAIEAVVSRLKKKVLRAGG
ncbi:MAG: DUF1952 domain-containing protein [Chloroflexi bacterium]|nr:DUF1952 domain-containing protein [Chloroflexota bacterium]